MVKVALTSDIHSPKYIQLFRDSISSIENPDLMIFAGDLVYRNDHVQVSKVLEVVRERFSCPIVSCFGNEEWEGYEERYGEFREITWLNDEELTLNIGGSKVYILGSRGSLDRPTFWQRTHVRGIYQRYRRRVSKIRRMLQKARGDYMIVVTHYAPTYKTLQGERETAFPEMGCRAMEEVIRVRSPLMWVHGHAHRSIRLEVWIGGTYVVNVALPAWKKVVLVELERVKNERLKRVWALLS